MDIWDIIVRCLIVGAVAGGIVGGVVGGIAGGIAAYRRVSGMNANVRSHPCPNCGEPLGNKPVKSQSWAQYFWGGWTCPTCGCDVDRHGKERSS
jgi:hypothetical protein